MEFTHYFISIIFYFTAKFHTRIYIEGSLPQPRTQALRSEARSSRSSKVRASERRAWVRGCLFRPYPSFPAQMTNIVTA